MSHPSFAHTDHRPWPLPGGPWSWAQSWRHLLFAHWRVPASALDRHIPPGLTLQHFDNGAWIGVIPFVLGVRPRAVPPLPRVSSFPELNVRTYVEADGKPGIWFFSLDAGNPIAVWLARRLFHLPYFRARMRVDVSSERIRYASSRLGGTEVRPEFGARYGPLSEPFEAAPGSLEHFLTERYCLYSADRRGRLHRAEVHHVPWPLQPGWAEIEANSMLAPLGIDVPDEAPVLHYSERIDVAVWAPQRVN